MRLSGGVFLNAEFTHPISQVAEQVGYESEASFTRAFERALGMPPAASRRERGRTASNG